MDEIPPSTRTSKPPPVEGGAGTGAGSTGPVSVGRGAPPPTEAAELEATHVVELHHSRRPSRERRWLWAALPVAGLLVVPAVGLVYAMTADLGPEAGGAGDGADPGAEADPKGKKGAKGKRARAPKARTDGAADCCAKLRELGKSAPIDQRAAYLSAAQACESAPDEDRAFRIAKSNVQTAKQELPAECEQ